MAERVLETAARVFLWSVLRNNVASRIICVCLGLRRRLGMLGDICLLLRRSPILLSCYTFKFIAVCYLPQ